MDILHVHQALGVDVVMADRGHGVSERHGGCLGMVGSQLHISTATRTATTHMPSRRREHKVGVATAGCEEESCRVMSG